VNYRNDNPPIMCDMTGAADTTGERMAEYRRLFTQSLLGRDRTGAGIRFRFRADQGMEDWVRDLADREKACCAFFSFTVTASAGEVWWDASVIDDAIARQILDEFYRLPDTLAHGPDAPWPAGALRPPAPSERGDQLAAALATSLASRPVLCDLTSPRPCAKCSRS
jgi:hypothetical protein